MLVACVTLWGSNFVFGSMLIQEFSPIPLAAVRLICTSLFLLAYAWFAKKFTRIRAREGMLLLALGMVGTLMNQTAFFSGLRTTDATTAALILSLSPLVTGLLAAVFLKETFTLKMLAGSIVALIGVFFVVGKGTVALSGGVGFMFLAMLTFSSSMIFMRKLTEKLDSFITTVYATTVGTIMLAPVSLLQGPIHLSHHMWAWLLLVGSAIVMQGICGLIWNRQLQVVGAGNAAMFLNLQPFVTMLVGFALLGTKVTLPQTAGAALIIGGVLVSQWKTRRKPLEAKLPAQIS
nr:DMT family transporter [Ectobacillus ponti]